MHEPGTLAVPGFSPPRAGDRTDGRQNSPKAASTAHSGTGRGRKPARGPCRPHSRRSRSAQWQKIGVSGYGILSNEGALGEAQLPPPFRGHPHMVSGRKDHGTGNILRRITAPSPLRKTISTANPAPARMHPSPQTHKDCHEAGNERAEPCPATSERRSRRICERHGESARGTPWRATRRDGARPPPRAGSTPLTSRARAPPPPAPPRTSPWGR